MARRQTNTVEEFQEEFRHQLAQHYHSLPEREPFLPPANDAHCTDGAEGRQGDPGELAMPEDPEVLARDSEIRQGAPSPE